MLNTINRKLSLTMCSIITFLFTQHYASLRELILNQHLIFMEVNFYGNENVVM